MSVFSSIVDRIFHHGTTQAEGTQAGGQPGAQGQQAQRAAPTGQQGQPATGSGSTQAGGQGAAQAGTGASASGASQGGAQGQRLSNVDVEAVLTQLASKKGGGGNWRTSIVDLLKLLDLDSSLDARKELGRELGVHAGADGSAEQNIALQKAVMSKLAENGGKVPDSLRH